MLTQVQGYEADHRDIKLLRLKNFTISRKLTDSDITAADGIRRIAGYIGSMVPFVGYIAVYFLLFPRELRSERKVS